MARSKWKEMTDEQKRTHTERERIRRKTLTDKQKQKQNEHHRRNREKRRANGKALEVEQNYRINGKGYFFKWANTIKTRAKKKNIPYDLDADFLESILPTHCPIFGVELQRGLGFAGQFSPTVDRLIPERGYIRDNVIIVSKRANQIKSDASVDEIKMVFEYYSNIMVDL